MSRHLMQYQSSSISVELGKDQLKGIKMKELNDTEKFTWQVSFASGIHKTSNTNEKTFEKQNELLHDNLGFMVAELESSKDSF